MSSHSRARPSGVRAVALAGATLVATAALGTGLAHAVRPNVLLIVTDDQRATGTLQAMPETRSWFYEGGTSFPLAFTTTPLCCPARASILSGQYAHNHGVLKNMDDQRLPGRTTLQSHLGRAGYHTMVVGKYLNNHPLEQPPPRFDQFFTTEGGYNDTRWNLQGKLRRVQRYSTDFIAEKSAQLVRNRAGKNRPWFMLVAPSAPHGPLEPAPRHGGAPVGPFPHDPATDETDLSDKPRFLRELVARMSPSPDEPEQVRAGQLRLLMSADDMVGRIRAELRRTGQLRRTLAIFLSDNGLLWGEHGGLTIKDLPYPAATQIPLALAWPGRVTAGASDRRFATNVDVAPTVLDATVAKAKGPPLDGRSLLDPGWRRDRMLFEYFGLRNRIPPWTSLVTRQVQFNRYDAGGGQVERELYRFATDPYQLENELATESPVPRPDVDAYERQLRRDARCAGRDCP